MIYLELLWGFLRVGLFSFGGAYAAIPLIRDVVLEYGWMNEEMVTYMVAVSESTPGPLMVNMATYVGAVKGGVPGALIATTAVALPSFFIIIAVTALMARVIGNKYVQATLDGIKASVAGVILATGAWLMINNMGLFINRAVEDSTEEPKLSEAVLQNAGFRGMKADIRAIIVTVVFAALYIGLNTVLKKKKKKTISPILLIVMAAGTGIVLFGEII